MSYRKPLVAIGIVAMLLVGAVGPVAAHSWQTTVTQGNMELGVSSTPEEPRAGLQTEFSARIKDTGSYENDANRTSYGGVTNAAVEVHIKGPDGVHDHMTTEIPADGAHFHFSYIFPTAGNYTITVVTTIDGTEYAFEFHREVKLLPSKATGPEMRDLNENVSALRTQVDDLESQVETLQEQNEELEAAMAEEGESTATSQDSHQDQSSSTVPGFGLLLGVVALAGATFVAGRYS